MAASPMAMTLCALMASAFVGFAYGQECHVDGNGSFPENTSELWQSFLLPVANMSKLYGEVMVIASQKDMHVGPKDSFKHIKYPTSFQTTLIQLDNELTKKQRNDSRLLLDLALSFNRLKSDITWAMALLQDHQTDMKTGREPRFLEPLRKRLSSGGLKVQEYIDRVGQIHKELRQVPGALIELASIERNQKHGANPIVKPDINDINYIADECIWRLKQITTIAQEFTTPFFQELSIWLQNMKSHYETFGQYAIQAAENISEFNTNLAFCEEFRLRRDLKYAIAVTRFFDSYTGFFESKSKLLVTESWGYWSALGEQDRDAKKAVEKLNKTADKRVTKWDNQLKSQWMRLQSRFSG